MGDKRSATSASATSVLDRTEEAAAARTLIDVLRSSAERYPSSTAIEDPDGRLSYGELMDEVDAGAAALAAAGVGVRLSSGSRGLYVAILAVLAAGAAYVPVDADDPPGPHMSVGETRALASRSMVRCMSRDRPT